VSPPIQRSGAPPPRKRPTPKISRHQATDPSQPNPTVGQTASVASAPQQLRRRRAAAWRCEPLADGRRDPLVHRHPDDWSARELESWAAAVAHLRYLDLPAVAPESVRQAWRRSCGRLPR
jgi:uncharacterized protein YfaQ (DUF2300 family)